MAAATSGQRPDIRFTPSGRRSSFTKNKAVPRDAFWHLLGDCELLRNFQRLRKGHDRPVQNVERLTAGIVIKVGYPPATQTRQVADRGTPWMTLFRKIVNVSQVPVDHDIDR